MSVASLFDVYTYDHHHGTALQDNQQQGEERIAAVHQNLSIDYWKLLLLLNYYTFDFKALNWGNFLSDLFQFNF